MNLEERTLLIKKWVLEAGDKIQILLKNDLSVQQKSNRTDLVTNIDKEIEKYFVEKIRTYFPDELIFSEEGFGNTVTKLDGNIWYLDPIDGTTNFIMQQKNYAVMIAVYEDGVGQIGMIYDVYNNKLYEATKGRGAWVNGEKISQPKNISMRNGLLALNSQIIFRKEFETHRNLGNESLGVRMIGSAGLEMMEVLQGRTALYLASSLEPWDFAPALILIAETGLVTRNFDGMAIDLLNKQSFACGTPQSIKDFLGYLEKKRLQ